MEPVWGGRPLVCPACDNRLNTHAFIVVHEVHEGMEDEDPHGPEPGDFTICSHCVTPLRVNPDGNAVRLDQLELMTISASLRSAIMHMLFVRWQKRQYDASPLGWSIEPLRGMVDWLPAKED